MTFLCNDYYFFTMAHIIFRSSQTQLHPETFTSTECWSGTTIIPTYLHVDDSISPSSIAPYSSLLGFHKAQVRRNETTEAKHANE